MTLDEKNKVSFELGLHEQHEIIINYLAKNFKFKRFIKSQLQDFNIEGERLATFKEQSRLSLINFFNVVCYHLNSKYSEIQKDKRLHRDKADISRTLKRLNFFLEAFSCENGIDSEHPIQLFNYYWNKKKSKQLNFHFACANTKSLGNDKTCSINHIKLDDAIELGKKQSKPLRQIDLRQPEKLKYLRNMKDVLFWEDENEEAEWFRKTGPIAADFKGKKVYKRKSVLDEIKKHVPKHHVTVLNGKAGSGKSVLVRQFAYDLIKSNPQLPIYYYSFKYDLQDPDRHTFRTEVNQLVGIIIIEDIHLANRDTQELFDGLHYISEQNIMLTKRIPSQKNVSMKYKEQYEKSISLPGRWNIDLIGNEIEEIIDYYAKNNKGYILTATDKGSIKKVCEDNLWLLSYALMGCYSNEGEGEAESWIRKGVENDFAKIKSDSCNPEILLALSPLYMNEVLTAHTFLKEKLNFDSDEIEKLLDRHEISKVVEDHKVYYGLHHSTLARAYWESRDDSMTEFLKHLDGTPFEDESLHFIYNYATYRLRNGSGIANGLSAILEMEYPIRTLMLQQLDIDQKTIITVMSETNIELFFDWIKSYGFYFSKNPTDNIWAKVIIPKFFSSSKNNSHNFTHKTISKIRIMCDVLGNKEKITRIVTNLPEEQSSDPKNMCETLLILSYINKDIMAEFWDSVNHNSFLNKLLCFDLYRICQNVTFLFWIDKKFGKHIWNLIDKGKLKARLNEINDGVLAPKAIGTFKTYLPDDIMPEFIEMFELDDIIAKLSALNEGFCRDYYITVFSLFNSDYKERLRSIIDIDSFIKRIPYADLVELSICIKYLFSTYPEFKSKLFELDYKALATKFDEEDYLDGVLRAIESIYTAYPEAGKKLCRRLNLEVIGSKLKHDELQYKTKEQFVEFISHIDSSVGEKLSKKAGISH